MFGNYRDNWKLANARLELFNLQYKYIANHRELELQFTMALEPDYRARSDKSHFALNCCY